ncbi:hypothetical protein [Maridesulfovibrio frigidus]|uniref:hypothetical protein n=1 Tax=Maridesulfovibrio frigidus TaxID=340956 RepID=UPI0004E17023|nr:hypothetical protein [Maridesulfovibrio frigidus]
MSISKEHLRGSADTIAKVRAFIHNFDTGAEGCGSLEFPYLIESDELDWGKVVSSFKEDFRIFDDLLFKLHFKRNAELSSSQDERIIIFLTIGYLYSNDVRYFNEFLFFYNEPASFEKYMLLMQDTFFSNIYPGNHHSFPLCDREEVKKHLHNFESKLRSVRSEEVDSSQRVALFGSPTFFKRIRADLLEKGFDVRCYFIPFHPDKLVNFVFKNRLFFKLFCMFKHIKFKFTKLNFAYDSPEIGKILENQNLDIGFHKLGFIIKNNVIGSLKNGLINDHWALLPFVRGRSTIEYSLLLGFPVAATTHLVEESVDSGGVVSVYNYDEEAKKCSSISDVKQLVRWDLNLRAVDSIEILSRTKTPLYENRNDMGLMFYSMHPFLEKFIEDHILSHA